MVWGTLCQLSNTSSWEISQMLSPSPIGDLPVTHFQLKVIGHPTENMDFCHTTPFCREGNTYI